MSIVSQLIMCKIGLCLYFTSKPRIVIDKKLIEKKKKMYVSKIIIRVEMWLHINFLLIFLP